MNSAAAAMPRHDSIPADRTMARVVICMENNKTRQQGLIFCESLRRFGGALANTPILAISPRRECAIDSATKGLLRTMDVDWVGGRINDKMGSFPAANKVFAMALAEQQCTEEILAFADSDSFIVQQPLALANLPTNVDLAVTPVWAKGVGTAGANDPAEKLWRLLVEVPERLYVLPWVRTRVTGDRIRFYCNSGLMVARRRSGILSRWRYELCRIGDSEPIVALLRAAGRGSASGQGRYGPETFLDQLALSAAVANGAHPTCILDPRYNSPIHLLRSRLYPGSSVPDSLDDIVHGHYIDLLHRPDAMQRLLSLPASHRTRDRLSSWLQERLPLQPISFDGDPETFLIWFEERMQKWRSAIN